jgi:hypothetical protein
MLVRCKGACRTQSLVPNYLTRETGPRFSDQIVRHRGAVKLTRAMRKLDPNADFLRALILRNLIATTASKRSTYDEYCDMACH